MSYAQKKKATKQVDPLIVLTSVFTATHTHNILYKLFRIHKKKKCDFYAIFSRDTQNSYISINTISNLSKSTNNLKFNS